VEALQELAQRGVVNPGPPLLQHHPLFGVELPKYGILHRDTFTLAVLSYYHLMPFLSGQSCIHWLPGSYKASISWLKGLRFGGLGGGGGQSSLRQPGTPLPINLTRLSGPHKKSWSMFHSSSLPSEPANSAAVTSSPHPAYLLHSALILGVDVSRHHLESVRLQCKPQLQFVRGQGRHKLGGVVRGGRVQTHRARLCQPAGTAYYYS